MKNFRTVLIFILFLIAGDVYGRGSGLSVSLSRIDSVIEARGTLIFQRQREIDRVREGLAATVTDTSRYSSMRNLYRLYRQYRCDSALMLAGERLALARKIGDRKRIQTASLNLAESYQLVGDLRVALNILDTVSRSGMEAYQLKYLYNIYVKSYRGLAKSEVIPFSKVALEKRADQYGDSALSLYDRNDPAYYRLRAGILSSKGHNEEAIRLIADSESKFGGLNANDNALMAELYGKFNNQEKALEYMSKAAFKDLSEVTLTHPWLMRLALMLNDKGDYDRARRYIRIALEDASHAMAQGLSRDILEAIPVIDDAYALHEKELVRWRLAFGIIATVLALTLAVALWFTCRQLKKTIAAKREAGELNTRLEQLNADLSAANAQKNAILNEFFEAYSDSIEQRKSLRKHIGRLLKTGQRSMAEEVVFAKSQDEISVQDMYLHLDRMIIALCPDFVEEYNAKVPEKNRVSEETLTSEARTLALIRFGITSGSDIARLLHYTSQTIYNYKSRLKSWGFQI